MPEPLLGLLSLPEQVNRQRKQAVLDRSIVEALAPGAVSPEALNMIGPSTYSPLGGTGTVGKILSGIGQVGATLSAAAGQPLTAAPRVNLGALSNIYNVQEAKTKRQQITQGLALLQSGDKRGGLALISGASPALAGSLIGQGEASARQQAGFDQAVQMHNLPPTPYQMMQDKRAGERESAAQARADAAQSRFDAQQANQAQLNAYIAWTLGGRQGPAPPLPGQTPAPAAPQLEKPAAAGSNTAPPGTGESPTGATPVGPSSGTGPNPQPPLAAAAGPAPGWKPTITMGKSGAGISLTPQEDPTAKAEAARQYATKPAITVLDQAQAAIERSWPQGETAFQAWKRSVGQTAPLVGSLKGTAPAGGEQTQQDFLVIQSMLAAIPRMVQALGGEKRISDLDAQQLLAALPTLDMAKGPALARLQILRAQILQKPIYAPGQAGQPGAVPVGVVGDLPEFQGLVQGGGGGTADDYLKSLQGGP